VACYYGASELVDILLKRGAQVWGGGGVMGCAAGTALLAVWVGDIWELVNILLKLGTQGHGWSRLVLQQALPC
jgi:hypothetical protein